MKLPGLFTLAALTACAAAESRPTVPLEAPVFVTGTGDTVRMREALRFGVLDGAEEFQFGHIVWMLPTADGGVILYDNGADDSGNAIRQYDARGRFVRTIGRQGEGPGEYGQFPMATLLVDGSLLIADQSLARLTHFDSSGSLVKAHRSPTGVVDLAPTNDGGWFAAAASDQAPDRPRPITYYRYNPLGELVESLPAPPAYRDGPVGWPHEARAMTIILPDGRIVSSRTDSIGFVVDGPAGSSEHGHASDRARFTEREKQDLIRRYAAVARRGGHSPESVSIPDLKPAYWYLVSDPAGRIIFLRNTDSYPVADASSLRPGQSHWRGTLQVDLFDSSATYRGRLVSPREVLREVAAFAPNALWLVHEGASGEVYVVKWVPEKQAW